MGNDQKRGAGGRHGAGRNPERRLPNHHSALPVYLAELQRFYYPDLGEYQVHRVRGTGRDRRLDKQQNGGSKSHIHGRDDRDQQRGKHYLERDQHDRLDNLGKHKGSDQQQDRSSPRRGKLGDECDPERRKRSMERDQLRDFKYLEHNHQHDHQQGERCTQRRVERVQQHKIDDQLGPELGPQHRVVDF